MITHKRHVDPENIETLLFEVDGDFRVRVHDLDVGETVAIRCCVDRQQAEEKFSEATLFTR